MSTCHSQLAKWCGSKQRLLLLNRVDMVTEKDRAAWTRYFVQQKTPVIWTDGVSGLGSGQVGQPTVAPALSWGLFLSCQGTLQARIGLGLAC